MGLSHDSLYYFSFAVLTLNAASALVGSWPGYLLGLVKPVLASG